MTRRGEARGALLVQLRDLQDVEADPARWSRPLHGRDRASSWRYLADSFGRSTLSYIYAYLSLGSRGIDSRLKSYMPNIFSGPGVLIHALKRYTKFSKFLLFFSSEEIRARSARIFRGHLIYAWRKIFAYWDPSSIRGDIRFKQYRQFRPLE